MSTTTRTCLVEGCGNPMPTGDNSTACPRCWTRLERDLAQMPALVNDLNTTITRQDRVETYRPGARRTFVEREDHDGLGVQEQPNPFHEAASDALTLLRTTLWGIVKQGLEVHQQLRPARANDDVTALAITALALFGWMQTQDDGHEMVAEIRYAVSQASRAIDRAPERHYAGICSARYGGCPGPADCECGCHDGTGNPCTVTGGCGLAGVECTEELYAIGSSPTARCHTCGTEHDLEARRKVMLEASAETLLTLTEMTAAVSLGRSDTVSRKQLEGWVRRGRLVRSGNEGAVPLYRVGDVLDILLGLEARGGVSA